MFIPLVCNDLITNLQLGYKILLLTISGMLVEERGISIAIMKMNNTGPQPGDTVIVGSQTKTMQFKVSSAATHRHWKEPNFQ